MNMTSECIIVAGPIPPTTMWSVNFDDEPIAATPSIEFALPIECTMMSDKPLHRLAEVRRQEGLTRRTLARRLGVSLREVEEQEDPSSDILLSDLYRWQQAMEVPINELLCEPRCELSPPVQLRTRLLLVMKTVRSIQRPPKRSYEAFGRDVDCPNRRGDARSERSGDLADRRTTPSQTRSRTSVLPQAFARSLGRTQGAGTVMP